MTRHVTIIVNNEGVEGSIEDIEDDVLIALIGLIKNELSSRTWVGKLLNNMIRRIKNDKHRKRNG